MGGVSFFQSVQPGGEGAESSFTVETADRRSLSWVIKSSINSPTSCGCSAGRPSHPPADASLDPAATPARSPRPSRMPGAVVRRGLKSGAPRRAGHARAAGRMHGPLGRRKLAPPVRSRRRLAVVCPRLQAPSAVRVLGGLWKEEREARGISFKPMLDFFTGLPWPSELLRKQEKIL
ncbi:PREDICTED: uncharacterized protein LOC101374609 [Odobenus rosmarus divergens]|uniref:Uncharacterized protein LOC101374609 n=1 Tax=Odobenus rosmarus divergens TaxID=9708 RepID=A0A9B0GVL8_ODORO